MTNQASPRLAVLIDADNAQASIIKPLLHEIAQLGVTTVRRAYGDWTTPKLKGWKDALNANALQPIQQFSYTCGKNATDSSLIIDAMDLLHSGRVDGFCLVSSDSDFTRLATRIRESGMVVYGFGEQKTPAAFVAACDKFFHTENLKDDKHAKAAPPPIKGLLESAVKAAMREDGWTPLSAVGAQLAKTSPGFDLRDYKFPTLGKLVRAQPYLEIKAAGEGAGQGPLYVRIKDSTIGKASRTEPAYA
jgi:hypothetical protein